MPSLAALFDTEALVPHGVCLLWRPELLWLHVVSDALTGLAYWSIPLVLTIIAVRRKDLVFPWAIELFAVFILACGATHFLGIWTLWYPDYGLQGAVKAATAAVSVVTAVALWPLLPRVLAIPSAATLAEANHRLTREVAERREAEQRARSSEARLAGFFEHLGDALFVVRATGHGFVFETVNPAFCRMFAVERGRIEGAGPEQLLSPEAAAELTGEFAACRETGSPRDWESTSAGPEGQRHWHTVLVPLPPEADGTARLLGSLRDVTELRRLQTDLVETARRATIGAMCAGVAHEMSQPVNIISLWADRSRASLEPGLARTRRAMEVILDQTRRLGTLLERMRDLARDAAPDAEPFDAGAAVSAAVEVAQRAWALDRIEVTLEPHPAAPVRGRPAQLEQAVLHLLENARDAVLQRRRRESSAPARITVSIAAGATPGSVTIAVRDTGGGVPAAIAPRMLEPFVTTKDPGQGTGLGLPLAVGIARGMGGRLSWANWAEGRPEAGAVFRLVLPLAGEQPAAAGQAA
ncbi:two-component system sensor histidine kinase NtrB [Paracraurococcus lichenis]|uniref:histidine kinase n=1 Tax=Paracraurococcus lichenis TaxID=3064888 RepID=A0ABT9E5A3_9PROT|nr:ATP-binding protein [Paracraurococcus sp. LOR1-02]MDO9711316.1 ATP-binding protein [Paracraurococcus sp. LOR1-02]